MNNKHVPAKAGIQNLEEITIITGFLPKTTKNEQLFMQNEPNFKNSKINVNSYLTRAYEDFRPCERRKNEPNTNPIRTQTNPIKANLTQFQSKTNPIKPNLLNTQMNVNSYLARYYEDNRLFGLRQNKPNQTQFQTRHQQQISNRNSKIHFCLMPFLHFIIRSSLFDIGHSSRSFLFRICFGFSRHSQFYTLNSSLFFAPSRLCGRKKIERVLKKQASRTTLFCILCFEFVSDFDIRI